VASIILFVFAFFTYRNTEILDLLFHYRFAVETTSTVRAIYFFTQLNERPSLEIGNI
jgi:hypothetical protein